LSTATHKKFAPDENEIENATRDIFAGAVLPGSKGLGKWLKKMKNRFFGEYKLVSPGSGTSGLQKIGHYGWSKKLNNKLFYGW